MDDILKYEILILYVSGYRVTIIWAMFHVFLVVKSLMIYDDL